jgi:ATP synthase protein I
VQYAAVLLIFAGAGYALDRWLGSLPWGLIGGVALGFFAATYSLLKHVPPSRSPGSRPPSPRP